ncbi:MAG: hypothetical protein IPN62_16610 [Flavobacteriales bacterium]|nr:hypothetical protein [Flavobacteriales bacterium]
MRTAKKAREDFLAMGLSASATDLLVKAEGHQRHAARVQATLDAAVDAVGCFAPWAIMLDLHGTNGAFGSGGRGSASQRNPVFADLGKGRWQASDGQAYRAAARDAYYTITGRRPIVSAFRELDDKSLTLRLYSVESHIFASPKINIFEHKNEEWLPTDLYMYHFDSQGALNRFLPEMTALARHAVLVFGGHVNKEAEEEVAVVPHGFENYPTMQLQFWGDVLQVLEGYAAEEEAKLDATMAAIVASLEEV